MKIRIWRAIFLKSVNDLDKANFGCHWSKNEHFSYGITFLNENISDYKRVGEKMFLFQTDIITKQIDVESTNKSNKEYPDEEECVLKRNTILNEVKLINQNEELIINYVNTGQRFCKWVSK